MQILAPTKFVLEYSKVGLKLVLEMFGDEILLLWCGRLIGNFFGFFSVLV